jgi:threonine/homoserine/homoserine lactone efflux protein
MVARGFRFGILLQIAIGPVCLLILQTALTAGFTKAESGVWAVVLVDALFIFAAIWGMGVLFTRFPQTKTILKIFGGVVLMLFGLTSILGIFGITLLPALDLSARSTGGSFFLTMLLLTLSNPLTILFWAGVFSTKLAEENFQRGQVYAFGSGAVLSTAVFLSAVALLGSLANTHVSPVFIRGLNLGVGLVLILFGLRTILKRDGVPED